MKDIYDTLYRSYGPQHWWPANTPFEVMIGAILTQNTAWHNVEKAITNLREHSCLSAKRITATPSEQLAEWLKPSGYFNIKARRLQNYCRWYLEEGGWNTLSEKTTPELRCALLSVNGIGPETADDILLYAFNRPVFVIDAYTRRLFSRLELIHKKDDYESLRAQFESTLNSERSRTQLFNEYHALIVYHAKYCCRKQPLCHQCCLKQQCAHKRSLANTKKATPTCYY